MWLDTTPRTHFGSMDEGREVDVVVVGGGIAGMETAYFLTREGLSVAVVEAGRIVEDVTGFTTGKLTSQHGLIYRQLTETLGPQKAKVYADANQAAIEKLASIIADNAVECDFRRTDSYVFTELNENIAAIRAEVEPARRLGLPVSFVTETPLDYAVGALKFEHQAQWHPRKFLLFLAGEIAVAGGYIFENTRALDIEPGKHPLLKTDRGDIRARSIVIATNTPFFRPELFTPGFSPTRSYVLGIHLDGPVPDGMFYTLDPSGASMRSQPVADGELFMVGGWDRGLEIYQTDRQYEIVEDWVRERFAVASIAYHWFTQDQKTADRVPLIGRLPGAKDVYMASGFNGWGMTSSCVAATIISDQITGRHNSWASLFDPARLTG
ncbi:MAG: NAD(P)/FAD-dependent oxidoreductase [Thermoleophilia bacterium]